MKKSKRLCALCLALIMVSVSTAVSVSAQSFNLTTLVSEYVTAYQYLFSNPKEAVNIIKALASERDQSTDITQDNSKEAQTFVRVLNIPATIGITGKVAIATVNPANSEQNRVLLAKINSPTCYPITNQNKANSNSQINVLAAPMFNSTSISINPELVFISRNNELVVIGTVQNYTGRNIEIRGIPYLELKEQEKTIASGNAADFEETMKMSYYRSKQVNSGVYDGLPDQCFIIMVFAPGTYDDTVDISSLDSLECNYSLDYSYLD